LVDLYLRMLQANENVHGEVFNTGPANGLSVADLVTEIARQIDWHGRVNWHTRPKRPGEIFYLNSSNEKARRAIGWEPQVNLKEGIAKTIEIWREQIATPAKMLCQVGKGTA
jgi:nucleoside-diphosphate-sugar epimerase